MAYANTPSAPDLEERLERLAINASEFLVSFHEGNCSGPNRTQTWLAKRVIADVAALLRVLPDAELQETYDAVIQRMRSHLGATGPSKGGNQATAVAFALSAGPVTLDKSDCGDTLTGASSFGGSATFAGGATVAACVQVEDKKPVGGSVSGGWKCSF